MLAAFVPRRVDVSDGHTTVHLGDTDQAGLHDVLELVRDLGLDIVDVVTVPAPEHAPASVQEKGDR